MSTRVKPAQASGHFPDVPTTEVGWLGVALRVPEDWSPVSVCKPGERGYLKIVSPDSRLLEIRWEQPKGAVSIPTALDRYLSELQRAARKSGREFRSRLRPKGLSHVRPREQAPLTYAWEADRKALGCIWHCGECGRLVMAELTGAPDAELSLAGELLRGIRDHGVPDPDRPGKRQNTWSLYGLTLSAPEAYRMERHTLMTGHQRFELRERGSTLVAERWGLAHIALRATELRDWHEEQAASTLRRYVYQVEETELHGHAALRFSGRDRVPYAIAKVGRAPGAWTWPRFYMQGYVWECPRNNQILAVFGEQPRGSTLVEMTAQGMCCHAGVPGARG